MRLEHVALWTPDIERARAFYTTWFGAIAGTRYENAGHGFVSYFLRFQGGSRLELMQMPGILPRTADGDAQREGLVHLAIDVGTPAEVDVLTTRMAAAGVPVLGWPRRTGDGYYESTVRDPDGNRLELAALPAPDA
jgi:lactoylglutathione lyase